MGLTDRLGFKRAAVAVARKIGAVLRAMWKTCKPFEAWPPSGNITAAA